MIKRKRKQKKIFFFLKSEKNTETDWSEIEKEGRYTQKEQDIKVNKKQLYKRWLQTMQVQKGGSSRNVVIVMTFNFILLLWEQQYNGYKSICIMRKVQGCISGVYGGSGGR